MLNNVPLGTLTIANGQTNSAALPLERIRYMSGFVIWAPATLPESVTVAVSYDGTNYATLQSAGTDVTVGAGKAVVVLSGGFVGLRLTSASSVAADRAFVIRGTEEIGSI